MFRITMTLAAMALLAVPAVAHAQAASDTAFTDTELGMVLGGILLVFAAMVTVRRIGARSEPNRPSR